MFLQLVCLVLIPAAITGNPTQQSERVSARILGGIPVAIEDFPYQVSLNIDGRHSCGGAIVSETFIITAAHCIYGKDVRDLTIRVNTSFHQTSGSVYSVKNRFIHPQYINSFENNADCDLSIVELGKPLTFGNGVQPIRLPKSDEQLADHTTLTVSGWGKTSNNQLSPELLAVDVFTYPNEECKILYQPLPNYLPVTDRMICGNVPGGGHNACNGDSGGPVTNNGVLYGVVSFSAGCATSEYPTVYTRIAHPSLRAFIKKTTGL